MNETTDKPRFYKVEQPLWVCARHGVQLIFWRNGPHRFCDCGEDLYQTLDRNWIERTEAGRQMRKGR